jgi:hypothetical protein
MVNPDMFLKGWMIWMVGKEAGILLSDEGKKTQTLGGTFLFRRIIFMIWFYDHGVFFTSYS